MQVQTKQNQLTTQPKTKHRRQPWIELLRIISIFLILLCHFNAGKTDGFKYPLPEMGQMGVITFFMISGWCSVKSQKERYSKFFVRLCINVFWGFIFAIVLYYTGYLNGIHFK